LNHYVEHPKVYLKELQDLKKIKKGKFIEYDRY
jgi:hypothetical protein